ncbi:MAG TPA: DUF1127 domain-containing protein [Aestuariivirga sp.]|nr:DUF1127 domain-containing protein [Aestuariivirga sp.]
MRKIALSTGLTQDFGFGLAVIRRVIRNWQARRKLRTLQLFDDYMLADIGLTRDDLHYGLRLSSRADIADELNRIRDQRIGPGIRRP